MTPAPHNPGPIESASLRPGTMLDKYQLVEIIGTGGSSVVWKAVEPLLGRTVAVKELTHAAPIGDSTAVEQFRQRVEQEIELHRRLAPLCPKIVQLYEAIVDERGAFLIMEHVQGPSLADVIEQQHKPLPPRYVVFVLRAIAQAAAQLHAQNVVHRDLKPGNILLPESGGVKLCDLGLAAMIADQEAMTLGSVRYMAPELCRGEQADERADLYSLGMIAYEMLAGPEGFDHAFRSVVRDQSRQAMRWIKWHTNARLTAPPLKDLHEHIPARLSDLVARLLEKDPVQRVRSAEELVTAIERNFSSREDRQAGLAPGAEWTTAATARTPGSRDHDTAALPQRKRWPVVAALAASVLVLGGGGWLAIDRHQQNAAVQARLDAAREQFETARQHYHDGDYAQAKAMFNDLLQQWPEDSAAGRHALAGLRLVSVQQHLLLGEYEQARAVFAEVENMELERISRQEIFELRGHIEGRRAFDRQVAGIRDDIASGELGQASRLVADLRSQPRSPEEDRILDELEADIQDNQQDHRATLVLDDVERLVAMGNLPAALARLTEAQRQQPHDRLLARLTELQAQHSFTEALRRAASAEESDNYAVAVTAYDDALAIRDDAQVREQRQAAQAEHLFRQGRSLLADRRMEEGREALQQAVALTQHRGAQALLAESEAQARRDALVQAGDEAIARNDPAEALQHYTAAQGITSTAEVQRKLVRAQWLVDVERVRQHMAANELNEAAAGLDSLANLDLDDTQRNELQQLQRRLQYWRHIHAGDAELHRYEYGQARRAYQRAQRLFNDDIVQDRIDTATFDDLIAQARHYINLSEWRVAEAMLTTAQRVRDNEEVQTLLEHVRAQRSNDDG